MKSDPKDFRKAQLILSLRNFGIQDRLVLETMERIPREMFMPEIFKTQAYEDNAMPIACGQTISQPTVVAFMTSQLELGDRMKVLEVGTGSGYQTAILSRLCRRVYSIERYRSLSKEAQERFKQLALRNITTMVGDGSKGWPAQAPFDRIIVTAAAVGIPHALIDQLAVGGIMVIPVETEPGKQELQKITKTDNGLKTQHLMEVKFVPLIHGAVR